KYMSSSPPSPRSYVPAETWRVDPGVLTWRGGKELVAYHLRTGRSYRLPSLPAWVRELLELGVALEVAAAAPLSAGGSDEHRDFEYPQLLEMLEREQLIGRVEELRGEEAEKDERGDLVLVIGSEGEGSNASPLRG